MSDLVIAEAGAGASISFWILVINAIGQLQRCLGRCQWEPVASSTSPQKVSSSFTRGPYDTYISSLLGYNILVDPDLDPEVKMGLTFKSLIVEEESEGYRVELYHFPGDPSLFYQDIKHGSATGGLVCITHPEQCQCVDMSHKIKKDVNTR